MNLQKVGHLKTNRTNLKRKHIIFIKPKSSWNIVGANNCISYLLAEI